MYATLYDKKKSSSERLSSSICLSSLVKLSGDGEDCGTAEEWNNLVDRGGLVHVNEINMPFSSLWKTR